MRPFLATKAFLAGLAVGLLYAPKSGAALRSQLLESFADRQSNLGRKAKEGLSGMMAQNRQGSGQRQPDYVPLPSQATHSPRPYPGTSPATAESASSTRPGLTTDAPDRSDPSNPSSPAETQPGRRRNRTTDTATDGLAGADGSA